MSRGEPEALAARSFDGTILAARRYPGGADTPLLVVNAAGVTETTWGAVTPDILRDRSVLTWDHRGLHGSARPASDRIDIPAHVEDAVAVLDRAGAQEVVVASWSSGSRIALELARDHPERVRALVVVCGGPGHPLRRLVTRRELSALLPFGAGLGKFFASTLQTPFRAFASRPEVAGFVRQSGFIGPTADVDRLVQMLRDLAACDLGMLLRVYEALTASATERLNEIEAPALLVAGGRDPFTPVHMMAELRDAISGAQLVVYEDATHYLPIEFPARLSAEMRAFLAELTP